VLMAERKSYRQFCGLARTLDHVGDRWTLLIVRELLLGSASFGELLQRLPGIATNLLSRRLRDLEADGLVVRSSHAQRSKAVSYALSERGRTLEPAVVALIRCGSIWMSSGPGDDHVDARWAPLALRALLADPRLAAPRGALLVDVDGQQVVITIDRAGRHVEAAEAPTAVRARAQGTLPTLLAVASGALPAQHHLRVVDGDEAFAHEAIAPTHKPGERARTRA
jgi:DNA-binding HxlR family transcriptional regulator